jgi:saccharopine dehydrogenase-like NADP-dependent oxidoreductase
MKVLLVGVGGVGEAIAVLAKDKPWIEKLVLCDYNVERAQEVQAKVGAAHHMPVEFIDAGDQEQVRALANMYGVDLIHNAVDPVYNEAIFDAAYEVGCNYMDMAMTLSRPHASDPYSVCGVKLGDYQFDRAADWKRKGLLAFVGMGVEPGMADVFAKYAEKHLFDEIEEIGVRDGANLEVRGYEFAPNFSIWTTIEECLNPPVVWEEGKGWCTTEPFSEPEVFDFPEGIGPVECVNVEHEEVLLVPRWVKCKRVTFKYGLGDEFINVLKTIKMLGLDNRFPIDVKGVKWPPRRGSRHSSRPRSPRRPDVRQDLRRHLGQGVKDGKPRQTYMYQVADNETCMKEYGVQAVVWQTAVNPVIAWELLETGVWKGKGVLGPEAFDPDPFVELMPAYRFPWGLKEMTV